MPNGRGDRPSIGEEKSMISAAHLATCTVVVSKGQSRNPEKRQLEQAITDACAEMPGVDVVVVPHLYDLPRDSESYRQLSAIEGDLVVVSWIYGRAAHWVLDRNGIRGQTGVVLLGDEGDDESDDEAGVSASDAAGEGEVTERVTDWNPRPERRIHCIDLKLATKAEPFVEEIRRIVGAEGDADGGADA